ncbi:MAG: flagellar hook-basal body complex protein FliE [Planctomycetes bacterium]|nr:flagellar hook-basal body complex protein FliE [Planctomycetota bacterium]
MSSFDAQAISQRIAQEFTKVKGPTGASGAAEGGTGSFVDVLEGYMRESNDLQNKADAALGDLVAGKSDDVHQVMLAMAKADVSFRMMVEVRNKLVEAYQEVMRMQV